MGIIRGCGTRTRGGAYLEVPAGEGGMPLEYFLVDPPHKLTDEARAAMGLSAIGVTLIERGGATHVMDWVGEQHYGNVADFLEEVRRWGVSRRIGKAVEFARLGRESRLILVHRRAWIDQYPAYYMARRPNDWRCAAGRGDHAEPGPAMPMATHCASLWWEDVAGGGPPADVDMQEAAADVHRYGARLMGLGAPAELGARFRRDGHEVATMAPPGPRLTARAMPSFRYLALAPPAGLTASYTPAIFASFPIARIAVVRDPEGGTHRDTLERVSKSGLLIVETDE